MTIPCRTTGSHTNAVQPRYVPSTPPITARHSIIAKPRDLIHFPMVTHTPVIVEPRIVMCTTTVVPTPAIDFMSASPDVKVINALDVKITDNPEIKAAEHPLVEQSLSEPPTYNPSPVEQEDTLHDFFHYVNRGTFGIPCGGKIYCPLLGMDLVAWPQEKSACLPRTLA